MNGTYTKTGGEKSAREPVPYEDNVQPESKWWTGGQSLESVLHNKGRVRQCINKDKGTKTS